MTSPRVKPHLMALILSELRQHPMTMVELQEAANISEPTTRRVLRKLQEMDWVTVAGKRGSTGGRRPRTYWLNGKTKLVIGVHLQLPGLHLLATDLSGKIVHSRLVSTEQQFFPTEAIQTIIQFVEEIEARVGKERIIGVGLASPGYLDSSGVILSVGRDSSWQNVPIAFRLQQELGSYVLVGNDVDCMAQAEIELDRKLSETDFIYLGFTEGVKASLILNGEFYVGPLGNAGNVGHTTVHPDGPLCACGNRGCLEALASVRAIVASFDNRIESEASSCYRVEEIVAMSDHSEKLRAILNAAEAGEPLCKAIVSEALSFLALAISNLINLFQVRLIIVGGALSNVPPGLWNLLDNEVRQRLPPLLRNNLTIRRAQDTSGYNAAFGASSRFIEHYLTSVFEQELLEIQL